MTSFVEFFAVDFNRDLNPRVDDLEEYLNETLELEGRSMSLHDFQYVRHGLNISVKIALEQRFVDNFYYNYCKIQNGDDRIFYYYVDSVSQVANNTLKVDMTMDTINSLIDPREFSDETEILREHEDRFQRRSSWRPSTAGVLNRNIDKESEGIVTEKFKDSAVQLQGITDNYDWYLIYKNQNEIDPDNPDAPNPVEISLCADTAITVGTRSRGSTVVFDITDFETGYYYYFLDIDNPGGTFTINSVTRTVGDNVNKCDTITSQYNVGMISTVSPKKIRGFIIHKESASSLTYTCIYDNIHLVYDGSGTGAGDVYPTMYSNNAIATAGVNITSLGTKWTSLSNIVFTEANFFRSSTQDYTLKNLQPEGIKGSTDRQLGIYAGPNTSRRLSTINDIDRTDSKLIKIIKYPYCPIPHTWTSGVYDFGENWTYDLGLLVYNRSNLPTLGAVCTTFTLPELTVNFNPDTIGLQKEKNKYFESKLYNSDFYSTKLVYDSFVKEYKLENIVKTNQQAANTRPIDVEFKPTNTINSKFGFKPAWRNAFGASYREEADFDNILLTTRNNEETILNNAYINYIKNGYNYDKKANALQIEQAQRNATASTIGTVLSAIGTIASIAAAPATGGASIAAGIGLATSGIASGVNATNQWANVGQIQQNQDNTMQSKLAQLAAQSTSTSGTDDVDLMSWYSGNKLWLMTYKTKDRMEDMIYKTLDYTGYKHSATATPRVDSRIWYNFIQCKPHIDHEYGRLLNLKEDWVNDLKQRYENGVTVFHHNIVNGQTKWNFERKYENWEKWIVEGGV